MTVHPKTEKVNLKALSYGALQDLVASWGAPSFAARQVWQWLYEKGEHRIERMTNIASPIRLRLTEETVVPVLKIRHHQTSKDGAVKYVMEGYDGQSFESVYLPTSTHNTVCVSTQVGCPVGCPFCATGQMGFRRNLLAAEMVEQVQRIEQDQKAVIRNIVLMGMGEPLLNYDEVAVGVRIWHELKGLSWKRVTLSTSGYLPGMEQLVADRLPVRLALSLHAPVNALRDQLVPLNKKYPLESLWPVCKAYSKYLGEPVTLEYVLLGGVNDTPAMARALVKVASGLACKVNVIPWNPIGQTDYHQPTEGRQRGFVNTLRHKGIQVTVRKERGVEINAACGQLLLKNDKEEKEEKEDREEKSEII